MLYAVLALLSERYPPLKGRSPTRYSPVRHSTQGRSPFRVRLACVRHAASVDSEPGSNSHVKSLFHPSTRRLRGSLGASQLLTRAPVDLALALFRFVVVVSGPPSPRTLNVRRYKQPPADTRRVLSAFAALRQLRRNSYLACTHYLVFKEPKRPTRNLSAARSATPPIGRKWPDLGEPSKVTSAHHACQPFFRCRTDALAAVDRFGIVAP